MSYDLVVWEGDRPATDEAAAEAFEVMCGRYLERDEPAPPTERIRHYVEALLDHWPDITEDQDNDSPWASGPLIDEAAGPTMYFPMVWSRADEASAFAAELAHKYGLVCFDPQLGTLRP